MLRLQNAVLNRCWPLLTLASIQNQDITTRHQTILRKTSRMAGQRKGKACWDKSEIPETPMVGKEGLKEVHDEEDEIKIKYMRLHRLTC